MQPVEQLWALFATYLAALDDFMVTRQALVSDGSDSNIFRYAPNGELAEERVQYDIQAVLDQVRG